LILAFIGVKLILHWGHGIAPRIPEIGIGASLSVIVVVLTITTVASLVKVRRDPTARAHAGTVTVRPHHAETGDRHEHPG
jgi:tellurite resistance protein TerC